MPQPIARRGAVVLAGAGALLLLALATAPLAGASTIYGCVKRKGGAVHIVSKAARCKKGEAKKSWNTKGPAGKAGARGAGGVNGATGPAAAASENGAPGAAGTKGANGLAGVTGEAGVAGAAGSNGSNGVTGGVGPTGAKGEAGSTGPTGSGGAVGGYSANEASSVSFTSGTLGSPTTVLSKSLLVGNFIVASKLIVTASDSTNGATWVAQCTLTDEPSTGATTEDAAIASGAVVPDVIFHNGEATMSLGMAVSTSTASTLTLACAHVADSSATGNFALVANDSLITAIQTTQNR
jgi:hypothetical protein